MSASTRKAVANSRWSLPFILLCLLLAVLCLAGGASRGEVSGQLVTRAATWALLVGAALFADRPRVDGTRPVLLILVAAQAIVLLQLIPLPPALWQALPGRALFAEAAVSSGQPQPWRPLSIVPGATINAAASLVVPWAVWAFASGLRDAERRRLPALLLVLVTVATFVGLLQLSGGGFDNPLLNDTPGQISGTFANRNHFALFLAFGCLIAPVWAFQEDHRAGWRGPVAIALVLLLVLTILATGSRAGLALGGVALLFGLVIVRQRLRRLLGRYPRWVFLALIGGMLAVIAIFVLISVAANRAESITRVFDNDVGQDMRRLGLPVVLSMVRTYFPAGTGMGSFDPMFRVHEPFSLLKLTYFNHAHNDLVEVVLDAGAAGLVLLAAALSWWLYAGWRCWRGDGAGGAMLPRLGWTMILLMVIASAFDYPARTPMMMAVLVIAGMLMAWPDVKPSRGGGSGRGEKP
ncbi:O-antigen ligase family protein [Sphingomonas sp. LR60]|uniref:O-antigen ligase family protein n=1 Tax=Sphingomonas sp. LR60 TaxID=3050233 RepID=UPI002FDFA91F